MKKIALVLLSIFLIVPCSGNIHINPDVVVSVVKEFVLVDKVESVIREYTVQLEASNGAGISAKKLWNICSVAGWDIKTTDGKAQCQKFVNTMVRRASIKFYPACDKQYKGKPGYICVDDFFTNKIYGGTQVNLMPGHTLAKEYARLKHNDTALQCKRSFSKEGWLDYSLMCTSHNQNAFYEFVFDDLEESKDKTIQDSIHSAVCRMYDAKPTTAGCAGGGTNVSGTVTCWGASCAADSAKCAKINQSMAKFGYLATYKSTNTCEINFKTVHDQKDLKTAYGIDNFVFCHGIQVANTPTVETYLKQYVAEHAGVSASSVKCDSGFNTYTGTGCTRNGITDFKDDIKTCRVGDKQIDFVFDDINEKWKKTVQGGVQGMSCVVSGGTYSGKRCIGLGEQQCNILRQSNLKECPECKAAKWDTKTQSCLLPSSASAQNLQKGVNIGLIVGGAVVGVALTVVTAGTAGAPVMAIVLTGIETVGAGIEITSQVQINAIADDFLVESNKCKNATCAKKMLTEHLQRMANLQNDMTAAEANAVDSELARLANLIPDDDEIWATMLVNGTDMADNKLGFFDSDSWEPEQVWRAVGVGLQLASMLTGITKWVVSKSKHVLKSTATIKQKFITSIDSVERAQDGTLAGNRLVLKRKIEKMRTTTNLDETEAAWKELWKKYAPRNQSLDDFKSMTDGNLEQMQEMSKGWISWDNPLGQVRAESEQISAKIDEFFDSNPQAMDLFQENPTEFAKRYPEIDQLQSRFSYLSDIQENGFLGNYSTFDSDARQITTNAREQINIRQERENFVANRLQNDVNEGKVSLKDAQVEYKEVRHRIAQNTTDKALLDIGNTVKIEQMDEVALLRADQIHDIIESDEWLKSMKQDWYSLTTDQKTVFAQEISDKLLEMNGVSRRNAPMIKAGALENGVNGVYNPTRNITTIDFSQGQNFEQFISTLAHENGGHAIDYLNPNANALGAQIHNATKDLYGVSYDAYRATPTEQTAFRIGDIASVVNSYEDYNDVGEVLMSAVQKQGVVPYDRISKQVSSYSNVDNLVADLLDPNKSVSILLDVEREGYEEASKTLMKTGIFDVQVFKENPKYFEFVRTK